MSSAAAIDLGEVYWKLQVRAGVRDWSERFFRSLYVDSTTQGDFGHVVRSSVGCLGSEIFWVMCLNLHIPDNAEKHCFEHKSQFLILKY